MLKKTALGDGGGAREVMAPQTIDKFSTLDMLRPLLLERWDPDY